VSASVPQQQSVPKGLILSLGKLKQMFSKVTNVFAAHLLMRNFGSTLRHTSLVPKGECAKEMSSLGEHFVAQSVLTKPRHS